MWRRVEDHVREERGISRSPLSIKVTTRLHKILTMDSAVSQSDSASLSHAKNLKLRLRIWISISVEKNEKINKFVQLCRVTKRNKLCFVPNSEYFYFSSPSRLFIFRKLKIKKWKHDNTNCLLTWSNDLSNDCREWTAACRTFPRVATVLFKFLYLK